jgi:carbonic anhydrase
VLGTSLLALAVFAQEPKKDQGKTEGHVPHWAYADGPGTLGPEHWSTLPGNTACGIGKNQSPIYLSH